MPVTVIAVHTRFPLVPERRTTLDGCILRVVNWSDAMWVLVGVLAMLPLVTLWGSLKKVWRTWKGK